MNAWYGGCPTSFLLAKGKGFGVGETDDENEEGRRIGIRRKGGA